jgi:phosphopantothenoylcysteine synthetase/decarboxylase
VIAPAMNVNMFEHEAVVENLELLKARGATVVEPGSGYLACGWLGKGRLAEPVEIVEATLGVLARSARPRRRERPGHRGAHGGGHRRRALRVESLQRKDGLPRRGGRA